MLRRTALRLRRHGKVEVRPCGKGLEVNGHDRPMRVVNSRSPHDRDLPETRGRDVESDPKKPELPKAIVARPPSSERVVELAQGHSRAVVLYPDLAVPR